MSAAHAAENPELAAGFARYLAERMPEARDVRVVRLERIHGGASRETWRVGVVFHADGGARERGFVLRRDPPGSLIETDRATEFLAYRAFQDGPVPVPRALWLEEDPHWLGRPFFVMEEVTGCESSPQALLAPPLAAHLERIGEQKWRILGAIARTDPRTAGLADRLEPVAPDACWRRELARWEGVLDDDELCPQPIGRAAIRWLPATRRRPRSASRWCTATSAPGTSSWRPRARSARSSTGRCVISATRSRTSPGR
jgi:aminoglycoside phosphotransferase (APT) family kinase protein